MAANAAPALQDHVDRLIGSWSAERPELDVGSAAVVYRVSRLAAAWNAEIEQVFARAGITGTDFAVLANLRRIGRPYQLTQSQLMAALRLTAGTISLRIDKLAERGLVERRADPTDGRTTLVTLADAGSAMFDAVAPEHLANESRLLAALSESERDELARVLRVLLVEVEQPENDRPDTSLGMTVAPAHVAQQRRAAVGLPYAAGLLVEHVAAAGPAASAGIQIGDLLTKAGTTPLRSLTCLQEAVAANADALRLTLQRQGHDVVVDVDADPAVVTRHL